MSGSRGRVLQPDQHVDKDRENDRSEKRDQQASGRAPIHPDSTAAIAV